MKIMGIIDKYFIKKPQFRKLVTELYYGNKNKIVSLFSSELYINTVKENGYLRAGNYADKSSVFKDEVSALINIASFISNDTSFIDVGANVGLFSSVMERFYNVYSNFNIYAFEANPDTFKRLAKTAENTHIQVFNIALSDENKQLEFVEGAVSHVFAEKTHSNAYHIKNQNTIKIEGKKLDEFDIGGNFIILKIDVEGHEFEVLQGAKKFFEANRVKAVYMDGYKKKEETESFLKRYGFLLYDGKTLKPDPVNNFSLLAFLKNS